MKGAIIIGTVWALLNFLFYLAFGLIGAIVSTYCCMGIVWFSRKKLSKLLKM